MERKHQHIARSLFFYFNIPLNTWNFYVQHAIHVINRLPTPLLGLKCLYEILFHEPPYLIHLKVFGCLCFASTLQTHMTNFDHMARKSIPWL